MYLQGPGGGRAGAGLVASSGLELRLRLGEGAWVELRDGETLMGAAVLTDGTLLTLLGLALVAVLLPLLPGLVATPAPAAAAC